MRSFAVQKNARAATESRAEISRARVLADFQALVSRPAPRVPKGVFPLRQSEECRAMNYLIYLVGLVVVVVAVLSFVGIA